MNSHLQEPISSHLPPQLKEVGVLALHGRNQTPDFILDIHQKLGWNDFTCLAPKAANNAWYPCRFMEPIEQNEPHLTHALETVAARLDDLHRAGFADEQIILMGFSQGACLASEFAVRNARRYKGIILFTGGLPGEEGTQWNHAGSFAGTPVFVSTSEVDEWVPPSRVKETARVFAEMGADVHLQIYKDRSHEVCEDEIMRVRQLMA